MKELTKQCLSLGYRARQRLIKILTDSLEEKVSGEDRFEKMYKIVSGMVGDGLLTSSRDADLVLGRCVIAYQMRQELYPLYTIGKCLCRDHSSVCCMCKKMKDVMDYPEIYKREMKFWKQFKEELDESEAIQENS